jgi:hypothetical protein
MYLLLLLPKQHELRYNEYARTGSSDDANDCGSRRDMLYLHAGIQSGITCNTVKMLTETYVS